MFCAIWYHLYNLKNKKNTRGGVLLLVKLQAFNTPPWVLFLFFKLYRWYQIAQNITYGISFQVLPFDEWLEKHAEAALQRCS